MLESTPGCEIEGTGMVYYWGEEVGLWLGTLAGDLEPRNHQLRALTDEITSGYVLKV